MNISITNDFVSIQYKTFVYGQRQLPACRIQIT